MRTAAVIRDMAETEIPELNISNPLGRFSPPEPVFETKSMVWFRSAKDFISYFGWNFPRKFFGLHGVAYRYFSDELCGRRLYYLVTAFLPDGDELKIVAEGPTDYSGSR
jgi:hypothetical protein